MYMAKKKSKKKCQNGIAAVQLDNELAERSSRPSLSNGGQPGLDGPWSRDDGTLYQQIFNSDQFTFFVGDQRKPIVVHSAAIALQSQALQALINSCMSEAQARPAEMTDIKEADFIRFCQFSYTGDYTSPPPTVEEPLELKEQETKMAALQGEPVPEQVQDKVTAPHSPRNFWTVEEEPLELKEQETKMAALQGEPVPEQVQDEVTALHSPRNFWCSSYTSPREQQEEASKKVIFRRGFEAKTFCRTLLRQQYSESCEPPTNQNARENFTTVLLSHARLYSFADKYGIEALRLLTLHKLHKTLVGFTLYNARISDIIALLRYTYSDEHTLDYDNKVDDLRALVSEYVVCEIETIGRTKAFLDLIEEGGPFVRDWWTLMRENVV